MLLFEFFTLVNPLSALNVQFIIFVYMNSVADNGLRLQNNLCFLWCATSSIAQNVYVFSAATSLSFFLKVKLESEINTLSCSHVKSVTTFSVSVQ